MSDEPQITPPQDIAAGPSHQFFWMIMATIGTALVLVVVAMAMYINSTASELDLSRPSFQAVRSQADKDGDSPTYPSMGGLDKASLDKFRVMYKEQYDKAVGVNGFSSDALSDKALELPAIE